MTSKRLASGAVAHYWRPLKSDIDSGFSLHAEPLGVNLAEAIARADELNRHLDDWRAGRGATKDLDAKAGFGTLEWMIERYKRSPAWSKVSSRAKPEYERAFKIVLSVPRKSGGDVGSAPIKALDARAVDKLYSKLKFGPRGKRLRQAELCIKRVARAWDVVQRLYPAVVPELNPFRDVELELSRETRAAATREQAFALHRALIAAGEPHLAIAPLVCFEWLQRPENVLAGHLSWSDYRPFDQPNAVRIVHHKTARTVPMPLSDENGQFFPELAGYLDGLEKLGEAIVLFRPITNPHTKKRGPARLYTLRDARARVREAARLANLPDWLTLDACRHGGITELADSGLSESQEMSMSGHSTPDAKRRYVKKTDAQRLEAVRKRRHWISEQKEVETQNGQNPETQNGSQKRA